MVEHNLAKVGVASSNLVSRSILFFILTTSLYANPITLQSSYCIEDESTVFANYFDKKLNNFKVIDIPKSTSKFDVPTLHVKSAFSEHNITVEDKTNGIITFKRNCYISGKKELLEEKVASLYKNEYPCIKIKNIEVSTKTSLPFDFKDYVFMDAGINPSRLRYDSGTLWVLFKTKTRDRKIYFNYLINAQISVFKAKNNMHNDKILSKSDFELVNVKVDNLPSNVVSCDIEKNLITKSYISADELLSYNKLEIKKDILKGKQIRAYIADGSLVIGIDSIILEDANIGDKVRIRTEQNKFFDAKLFSHSEAMILK